MRLGVLPPSRILVQAAHQEIRPPDSTFRDGLKLLTLHPNLPQLRGEVNILYKSYRLAYAIRRKFCMVEMKMMLHQYRVLYVIILWSAGVLACKKYNRRYAACKKYNRRYAACKKYNRKYAACKKYNRQASRLQEIQAQVCRLQHYFKQAGRLRSKKRHRVGSS